MQVPSVPGVLIDGHNYSGKSTLSRMVAEGLRARQLLVRESHGTMTQDGVVNLLLEDALALCEDIDGRDFYDAGFWRPINSLRSAQVMVDAQLSLPRITEAAERGDVFVQDRYWLTQHASNLFLSPGEEFLSSAWVATRAPRFTVQVYLTCEPQTRRARCAARGAAGEKHHLNTFLRRNIDGLIALDRFTAGMVHDDPEWMVLQSDTLPPEVLAAQVLAACDSAGLHRPARTNPA